MNKLINIVEKNSFDTETLEMVEKARVFIFKDDPLNFLPKQLRNPESLKTNFFMPFRIVGIEDTVSFIIIKDTEKDQKGFENPRIFIERISSKIENETLSIVTKGIIDNFIIEDNTSYYIGGKLQYVRFFRDSTEINLDIKNIENFCFREALKNTGVAIQEVMILNTPDRFIIEKQPLKVKKRKSKRIKRKEERSIYLLLKVKEIDKLFYTDNKSLIKRKGHPRRRHSRVLKSPYFKNKRGETIIVPSCWVGPTETTVKNKKYIVRTDL